MVWIIYAYFPEFGAGSRNPPGYMARNPPGYTWITQRLNFTKFDNKYGFFGNSVLENLKMSFTVKLI